MNKIKKSILFILLGILNLLHAGLHIIQFIQSIFLVTMSLEHDHQHEGFIDSLLHNPIFAILWGVIGLLTLWIGIKDFRHHNKCKHD